MSHQDEQTFEQRWCHTREATEQALVALFGSVHELSSHEVRRRLAAIMDECEERLMTIVKSERRRLSNKLDRAIRADRAGHRTSPE